MAIENRLITEKARESLRGKWWLGVQLSIVYLGLTIIAQSLHEDWGDLVSFVITGPLTLGLSMTTLAIARNESTDVKQLFLAFKKFKVSFILNLLTTIFVILWSILLIIPGIIAAISYSMSYYILIDNPGIKPIDAIRKSKQMMYGYKWKAFLLGLRFLGWAILSLLTLGIGFLWLIPYIYVSYAKFYEDIKSSQEQPVATA